MHNSSENNREYLIVKYIPYNSRVFQHIHFFCPIHILLEKNCRFVIVVSGLGLFLKPVSLVLTIKL